MPQDPQRWLLDTRHPDFIVCYKPAGLSFHQDGAEPGFVAQLKSLPGLAGLHPVHRLDRITSGLVLFARHVEAARAFGQLFEARLMGKLYLALSVRKPTRKQGTISGTLLAARNGSWRLAAEDGPRALTQFFSYGLGDGSRLFVLRPYTGRTHQLRVAMKSLGAPILGDTRYGGVAADRGYLHAAALRFDWQGQHFDFWLPPSEGEAMLRPAFNEALARIGTPWDLPWPRPPGMHKVSAED